MNSENTAKEEGARWYALWTRSNREKSIATALGEFGVSSFLPLIVTKRQWTDRVKMVSVPLFAGYVFAKVELAGKLQFQILNIPGVAGFVGNSRGPTPIPTTEIETVRQVLSKDLSCTPCVFLQVGDRVRVKRGPLLGVEGILVRTGAQSRLVIGVELIYRSMLVTISELDVEPLRPQMKPVFADSWQMNQIRA